MTKPFSNRVVVITGPGPASAAISGHGRQALLPAR
jgi:hypothetical protein